MTNILTPNIETHTPTPQVPPQPGVSEPVDWKHIEFLDYMGLKEELSNEEIMAKISLISDVIPDLTALMETDLKLGRPEMSKLDKIYSYAFLLKQEQELGRKQDLINKQKLQWQDTQQPARI